MTTITDRDLLTHKRLMTDFIYAIAIPRLLDVKGVDPDKALEAFRQNQHYLLKKYGFTPTSDYYIDFNGVIKKKN